MLHDETKYPDAFKFNPERYADEKKNAQLGINELPQIAFGFGRRYVMDVYLQWLLISDTASQSLSWSLAGIRHCMGDYRIDSGRLQHRKTQRYKRRRHRTTLGIHRCRGQVRYVFAFMVFTV